MASSKHCRKGKAADSIARCDASMQLCLDVTPGVDAFPVAIDFVDCVLSKWVDFGSKNGGFRTAPHGITADGMRGRPRLHPPASRSESLAQFINPSQLNTTQNDSSMGKRGALNQTKHDKTSHNISTLLGFLFSLSLSHSWPHLTFSIGSYATTLLLGSRQTCAENLGINLDPVILLIQSGLAFLSDSERI